MAVRKPRRSARRSPASARGTARSRERRRESRPPRERGERELRRRVLWAVPAAIFAIFIIAQGGLVFALGISALGVVALHELYSLTRSVRPVDLAGFIALVGLVLAALFGEPFHVLLVLVCAFPLTYAIAVARPWRERVSWAIAMTLFGVAWVGLPLVHAVFLREIEHGGALVLDALLATFIGDSIAYSVGKAWGQRKLAPRISPNKSWEGLVAGLLGGTLVFWGFETAYQEFLTAGQALAIGFCVALAAPLGDLFESLIKRDFDVKDTGGLFGPHGGVLDRLDAVFFSVPVAYYVTLAVT
ncbi:phosphatidate cytidylyltransferase [soil metagenome]